MTEPTATKDAKVTDDADNAKVEEVTDQAAGGAAKADSGARISTLMEMLNEDPDAASDPAVAKAIASLEAKRANRKFAPTQQALAKEVRKLIANGTVPADSLDMLDLLRIQILRTESGDFKDIEVIVAARKTAGSRAAKGEGSTVKVSQQLAKDSGFQAFVVGNKEFGKPIDAILAAGGEKRKKEDGTEVSENYWRVIFENGYLKLPIQVRRHDEIVDRETFKKEMVGA
jgi:hypothetical protein